MDVIKSLMIIENPERKASLTSKEVSLDHQVKKQEVKITFTCRMVYWFYTNLHNNTDGWKTDQISIYYYNIGTW